MLSGKHGGDMAEFTNAAEMARARGVNGKTFRARLRRNLPREHIFGSWDVEIGSSKHQLMASELDHMMAEIGRA